MQAKLAKLDANSSRDSAAEWLRSQLVTLETDLQRQAQMIDVAKEAAFSDKAKARWAEAIEAIAKAPKYAGQKWPSGERLTPQLGLLPLGETPVTGLWEFVHLQTGTEPALGADGRVLRDAEGRLTLTPETGMVFVLLPGGRVPKSTVDDGQQDWITQVDLDPLFLSKYELTHEQWDRVSLHSELHSRRETPLFPANGISWDDVTLMLRRELGGAASRAKHSGSTAAARARPQRGGPVTRRRGLRAWLVSTTCFPPADVAPMRSDFTTCIATSRSGAQTRGTQVGVHAVATGCESMELTPSKAASTVAAIGATPPSSCSRRTARPTRPCPASPAWVCAPPEASPPRS